MSSASSSVYTEHLYGGAQGNASHAYLAPVIRRCLARVGQRANILDLGCGNGALTVAWARPGDRITGVHLAESGITAARSTFPSMRWMAADVMSDLRWLLGGPQASTRL